MMEFIIESDEEISKAKYRIWISFNDEPIGNNTCYICSGTALIIPGDENNCWFDFNFHHTPDWREIIKLHTNAPAYTFSREELLRFGRMIASLISQYIAKYN